MGIPRKLFPIFLGLLPLWAASKPNLSGAWRMSLEKSDSHFARLAALTWVIDQKEAALHISEIARQPDGKETKRDFDCTTDGKECSTGEKGQPTRVSFWYNGAVLVELESRGANRESIIKKRMTLSEDGKLMRVELIPVVGSEQAGKLLFEKQ